MPPRTTNKAIGLESHIGSWLACYLEPTVLLAKLHEPRASSHHRNMKPRRYNPQLAGSRSRNMRLAHSLGGSSDSGLDARRTASPHWGARESFSLDIPSHRILSGMYHLNFLVLLLRPFFPRPVRILIRQNGTVSSALAFGNTPQYTACYSARSIVMRIK